MLLVITAGTEEQILEQIARQLASPGDQLPEPPLAPIPLSDKADYTTVPRVTIRISAGATGYAIDFIADEGAEPVVKPTGWFRRHGYRPEMIVAITVTNGSMEPNYHAGDVVLVDRANTELRDGAPVAANFEGEPVLIRLQRDAGQWWLTSDNPDKARYPRKLCSDGVTIIGRVILKETENAL